MMLMLLMLTPKHTASRQTAFIYIITIMSLMSSSTVVDGWVVPPLQICCSNTDMRNTYVEKYN